MMNDRLKVHDKYLREFIKIFVFGLTKHRVMCSIKNDNSTQTKMHPFRLKRVHCIKIAAFSQKTP